MPPRKKKSTTAATTSGSKPKAAPTTVSPLAKPKTVDTDTPKVEAPAQDKPQKAAPKAAKPSAASLARRKRELIDELRSEHTAVSRATEIHKILRAEFAGVPILSHQELSRLGD